MPNRFDMSIDKNIIITPELIRNDLNAVEKKLTHEKSTILQLNTKITGTSLLVQWLRIYPAGASLVAQRIKIHLPTHDT